MQVIILIQASYVIQTNFVSTLLMLPYKPDVASTYVFINLYIQVCVYSAIIFLKSDEMYHREG